jgi:hypothetical protein
LRKVSAKRARPKYREIPKPKAGDRVSCGQVGGTLDRRISFGCWEAHGDDGQAYRVQGLAEVALLVVA